MEVRNVEDCFRFRLLRKINPDKEKTERSFEVAKQKLKEAENALKLGIFEYAVLEAYMGMFHASRALLYRDGIQEKSHFAIYIYLKERYGKRIPLPIINFLNIHRTERHEALYGLEYKPSQQDAQAAVKDAKIFIEEMEKQILNAKDGNAKVQRSSTAADKTNRISEN